MRRRLAFEVSATGEVRFDDAKGVKHYLATLPAGSYYMHPKKLTPFRLEASPVCAEVETVKSSAVKNASSFFIVRYLDCNLFVLL